MPARIVCLDLDTFFVSVERKLDPRLVGKPVIVGATGWHGVVTSASYEVRALGVRAGMPIAEARRRAPRAVYVAPRHGVYSEYAAQVREILLEGTDAVVTASIDEFFLDFHGTERLWRAPADASDDAAIERRVRELRAAILDRTGLPASAGIGVSRSVAKIGSKLAKPHVDLAARGVRFVPEGTEIAFVRDLGVGMFPGIGPVATAALEEMGVRTLGQLLQLPPGPLRQRWGSLADRVRSAISPHLGAGRDRPAFHEHDPVGLVDGSISNERTMWGLATTEQVDDQLRALVERVCWRARRRGVVARTVTVKVRTSDFHTCTRSRSGSPTADDDRVLPIARELLASGWVHPLPIRLVGVALSHLEAAPTQLALPIPPRARPRLSTALDAVRDRFGYDAARLGSVRRTTWLG
jgi:DNA polymerase IV